jgi:hypothetical protein
VTNLAKFTIEGTASSQAGYDGTAAQVLHFALEASATLVQRWTLQVYDPNDTSSPKASYGAPLLTLVGATSGQNVDAATPGSQVTCTLPSGMNSWIVRSVVNGGLDAHGVPNPNYVFERMVVIRDGSGRRRVVVAEATQYGPDGWARALNEHLASVPNAVAGGTERGQKGEWNGTIYVPMRDAVTSAIDLTGATDAKATIRADLAALRYGSWYHFPDGLIRVGLNGSVDASDIFTVPAGVTVTFSERGAHYGHRVFTGDPNFGSLLNVYDKGNLFTLAEGATVIGPTIYYPQQNVNSAPVVYGDCFVLAGHGNTVKNVTAINPYRFAKCTAPGPTIQDVKAFPLNRGIWLARVGDVARITGVNFTNANLSTDGAGAHGATLLAYVQANATSFYVDGAEQFEFVGCFSYGYNVGLRFTDLDGDGFRGAYGNWIGGGWDIVNAGILVEEPNGLTLRGLNLMGARIIPNGATANGILFSDTHSPANADERPSIYASNCHFWNAHSRSVFLNTGSAGNYIQQGGSVRGQVNEAFRNSGSGLLSLDRLGIHGTRTGGAGTIVDTNQWDPGA